MERSARKSCGVRMRKTRDLISSLDPFKKRELVATLEEKKEKERQQRLAIAQRRAAEKATAARAGGFTKAAVKAPTRSRAFMEMLAKLEVDPISLALKTYHTPNPTPDTRS